MARLRRFLKDSASKLPTLLVLSVVFVECGLLPDYGLVWSGQGEAGQGDPLGLVLFRGDMSAFSPLYNSPCSGASPCPATQRCPRGWQDRGRPPPPHPPPRPPRPAHTRGGTGTRPGGDLAPRRTCQWFYNQMSLSVNLLILKTNLSRTKTLLEPKLQSLSSFLPPVTKIWLPSCTPHAPCTTGEFIHIGLCS